jgi:hypothetical protein
VKNKNEKSYLFKNEDEIRKQRNNELCSQADDFHWWKQKKPRLGDPLPTVCCFQDLRVCSRQCIYKA